MDVTNPGLVNVADQAFKPDVRVNALEIPRDDDILVPIADEGEPPAPNNPPSQAVPFNDDTLIPVADQGEPRAENDVTSSIIPVPAESIVARQAAVPVSQDFGEVPGVAPAFLPFPPSKTDPNIQGQNLTAGSVAEFTVAGPDISIETNQSAETQKNYAVTAVLDANTGLPPAIPVPSTTKPFASAQDGGAGIVTIVVSSASDLPPSGKAVAIAGTPAVYNGIAPVSNVLSLGPGTFSFAVSHGAGKTTLASTAALPNSLKTKAKRIQISNSPVSAYNNNHAISNVVSGAGGSILSVASAGVGLLAVVASAATGLADNQVVNLAGTNGYDGFYTVLPGTRVDFNGSFLHVIASSQGPGFVTIQVAGGVPVGVLAGQLVTIADSTSYDAGSPYAISNVTASSFDIPWGGAITDESGNWSVYNFSIAATYVNPSLTGTWASNTFDIDVAFAGWSPGTGNWAVYTFDIPGIWTVTASGNWTYTPPQLPPATRYQLTVAPPDLSSFGVSMLGRPIVFDDAIFTVVNEGASRSITGYGANFVVINRSDDADLLVPYMDDPQAGDTFTLDVQRQGSEVISRDTGTTEDVTILPPPQVDVPTGIPSAPSQGNVEVSTGPQPGEPIITSGVNVPTAITVNIADQDLVGPGLPKDVFP